MNLRFHAFIALGSLTLAGGIVAWSRQTPAQDATTLVKGFTSWKKATLNPHLITPQASELCRAASLPAGPHTSGLIEVRVNDVGYKAFLDPKKPLPVGTIVIKEKRRTESKAVELLTVMQKVAQKGTVDDWKFYALSGDGKKALVTDSARCRNCHESAGVDHLFRTYELKRTG